MDVGVGEAGDHGPPREVDLARAFSEERLHVGRAADGDDPPAPDGQRRGPRMRVVEGDDHAAVEHQVGGRMAVRRLVARGGGQGRKAHDHEGGAAGREGHGPILSGSP